MTSNDKIIRAYSVVMASFIALYAFGTIAFLHVHYSPSGEIIIHSHPHSDSRDGSDRHRHSNTEFKAIALLNKAACSIVVTSAINLVIPDHPGLSNIEKPLNLISQCVCLILSGRSPPYTHAD